MTAVLLFSFLFCSVGAFPETVVIAIFTLSFAGDGFRHLQKAGFVFHEGFVSH